MTLAEAINRISKQDNCTWDEAKDQIRAVLADNAIGPLRWEDERPTAASTAPVDPDFWEKADIRRDGKVFDPWTKRWRTLLIPKQSIFQIWPEQTAASAGSESGKAGTVTKAKDPGHAEIEIHQAFDRLFQRGLNLKDMYHKTRAELVHKECGIQFDKRTVQKYFRSWLEKHRTDV
jgi:hypothetical protein